jgi:phytoene dehydrogenase-like protein
MTQCGIGRRLQDMLAMPVMYYGNTSPRDMVFGDFATMFKSVICEGFARPTGGMKAFLKVLTDRFTANGGVLAMGNGITALESSGGRVTAAVDSRGERHTADQFITTAGAVESAALLGDAAPVELKGARPGEMAFVEALFRLPAAPSAMGFSHCVAFVNRAEEFDFAPPAEPLEVPRSMLVCAPGNYQGAEESPLLRVSAITRPEWWFDRPEEEYRRLKRECAERCLEALRGYAPEIAANAECIDFFTPRTIKRFTGHCRGLLYGSPDKLRDCRTGLENLTAAGTDQGLLGIVGAMLSGILAANLKLS